MTAPTSTAIEPGDEDIAEALRLSNIPNDKTAIEMLKRSSANAWQEILAHARTLAQLRASQERIAYLEKRLEVVPGWSEDADGIACRNDTIALLDERIRASEEREKLLREAAETLRREATFLCQNSEACAVNHYGHDFATHGMPQWLVDSRARIIEASQALAHGGGDAETAVR